MLRRFLAQLIRVGIICIMIFHIYQTGYEQGYADGIGVPPCVSITSLGVCPTELCE